MLLADLEVQRREAQGRRKYLEYLEATACRRELASRTGERADLTAALRECLGELPEESRSLILGGTRIVRLSVGTLHLCARPDRVVIEEGVAKAGQETLLEGVEYRLEGAALRPVKTRTLPPAERPRETLSWRIELDKPGVLE